MTNHAIVVERLFNVPAKRLWKAITDKTEMKSWYFDLEDFRPVVGFQFQFTGETNEGIQYLHLCEITEVVPDEKLTYSWRYDGYPGISFVTFELFGQGSKTRLRLTHKGIQSFPQESGDFALQNFEKGWNEIINKSLATHLDKGNFQPEIA